MLIRYAPVAILFVLTAAYANAQADVEDEIVVRGQLDETIPLKLAEFDNRVEVVKADEIHLGGYIDSAKVLQMRVPRLYLASTNEAFDHMTANSFFMARSPSPVSSTSFPDYSATIWQALLLSASTRTTAFVSTVSYVTVLASTTPFSMRRLAKLMASSRSPIRITSRVERTEIAAMRS